jgi:hypothetical protein
MRSQRGHIQGLGVFTWDDSIGVDVVYRVDVGEISDIFFHILRIIENGWTWQDESAHLYYFEFLCLLFYC